jgi:hypothetical protein
MNPEQFSTLTYHISGLDNLTQFLQVTEGIATETGMHDWQMKHRGIRMRWNWQDAKAVISGKMSEETYIERNRMD